MDTNNIKSVEILKRVIPTWPELAVKDSVLIEGGVRVRHVRTAITLLRLKNDTEYKLVRVRYDERLPEKDPELSWLKEGLPKFLSAIQDLITHWDGRYGTTDNDQSDKFDPTK